MLGVVWLLHDAPLIVCCGLAQKVLALSLDSQNV